MDGDLKHLLQIGQSQQWDDASAVPPEQLPTPRLKITGIYVRGLGPITQLNLPRDGLAWQTGFPDVALLGGINGSGKTTLLNFIHGATSMLAVDWRDWEARSSLPFPVPGEAWIDYEIESRDFGPTKLRFAIGDDEFVNSNVTDKLWALRRSANGGYRLAPRPSFAISNAYRFGFGKTTLSDAILIPSGTRELVVPEETYKVPGTIAEQDEFAYRWRPPKSWKESLEAFFYAMRWEDLSAKAAGKAAGTGRFDAYAEAFQQFTGRSKRLEWSTKGELQVKLADTDVAHSISELSSGEKQLLLLVGELLRRWRPGSLIMIDEPELHLHSTWQTKLYDALRYWQAERGGQIILATQSSHLFELAGAGTTALLGVDTL